MTQITILGSTGTIGVNTLNVIQQHRQRFHVFALTANTDVESLVAQCVEWQPQYAVMADESAAMQLQQRLQNLPLEEEITVLAGVDGLTKVASLPEVDVVMAAIVGSAGLLPTLAAAQTGKRILLANKEALVMAGQLFIETARQHQAILLPIDSEHNAIFQCMPCNQQQTGIFTPHTLEKQGIEQILLTASGGPFRDYSLEQLVEVTPEQACAHPNWKMGKKISVDSATMMNKGLEVIEACWLFATMPDKITVVLHPQSIIHSLVAYIDGSVLAQLGNPDMRTPIAHALAWPARIQAGVASLDLTAIVQLDFQPVDMQKFPCLRLAYEAMLAGGTTTTILNAANEMAVAAFLQRQLGFTDIAKVIEMTLSHLHGREADSLAIILEDDKRAREIADTAIGKLQS